MRVVLTRSADGSGELAARLRADGFDVAERPLVRIEPAGGGPLEVSGYDWVVVTSTNGARLLAERTGGETLPRVAAIGAGTALALAARGIEPALVAERSTQEGLVEALRKASGGDPGRVLFAGAADARDVVARELGADVAVLYRTVEEPPADFPEADLVVLASGSAARAYARLGREAPCVSIGPVTSAEARRLGLAVLAEAERPDADALAAAVRFAASRLSPSSRS